MARIALDAFDVDNARRLALALMLSVALHAGLIVAIRSGPPNVPTAAAVSIEARIVMADRPAEPEASTDLGSAEPADAVERSAESVPVALSTAPARDPAIAERAQQPLGSIQANNTPAAAQAPLAPDSTYHAITALDRPPAPLTRPDVCYPHGATGEVTYELMIDEAGSIIQAIVLAVKPVGLFTAAAAELCSAVKFSPAIKDGRAVRSRVRFVVAPGPG
jgi:outer membrane biosynthesis protein TonB